MDIRKISQSQAFYEPKRVQKEKEDQKKNSEDSVELSPEAVQRFQSDGTKKIDAVREKVDSGFYFNGEVTRKVADELLKRFTTP